MEVVHTNKTGTDQVLTAAIHNGIKKVAYLSMDKTAYTINTMRIGKSMIERVFMAKFRTTDTMAIKRNQIWQCDVFQRFRYSSFY